MYQTLDVASSTQLLSNSVTPTDSTSCLTTSQTAGQTINQLPDLNVSGAYQQQTTLSTNAHLYGEREIGQQQRYQNQLVQNEQKNYNNQQQNQDNVYTSLNQETPSLTFEDIGSIINGVELHNIGLKDISDNDHQAKQKIEDIKQSLQRTLNLDDTDYKVDQQVKLEVSETHNCSFGTSTITLDLQSNHNHMRCESNLSHPNDNNNLSQYLLETSNDSNSWCNTNSNMEKPYVEIIEQPAKCSLRFRYKCEGRSAGSLPGISSTAETKTFPAIKICNYVGKAVIVISCVTSDPPYRAHPHNIVGKEGCKKGTCTIVVNCSEPNLVRSFTSLGIQCVKRKEIEDSLTLRESIKVDPFRTGFSHKHNSSNIDLNVIRLCFQVFIEGKTPGKCNVPLQPVISSPIHDKKAMSDLLITKLSHCSAPATGGREVILLCDRISKDDIQVRFFEERAGKLLWEEYVDLSPTDIHKQVAICFRTPKYHNENITQPVMASIQLKRKSDNHVSEPRMFQILPCESDEDIISRKRQKISMNQGALDSLLQLHGPVNQRPQQQPQPHHSHHGQHHNQEDMRFLHDHQHRH